MDKVHKFETMMSRAYEVEYKPSACEINPYIRVIEHKTRPRLEEVNKRNMYRRSLSALLNSKAKDPLTDKSHSTLNTLHKFEHNLQTKVSQAAPTKEHQNYAALRQGRDPRMNESNAHFDRQQALMNKENQGFNVGRHVGERPSTAVLAWRPQNPFFTYEQNSKTKGQVQQFTNKRLHAKVMNERVQVYNQKFLPEHLLPSDGLAWVKKESGEKCLKKSQSQEHFALPQSNHEISLSPPPKAQQVSLTQTHQLTNKDASVTQIDQDATKQVSDKKETAKEIEERKPIEIMEAMRGSNIKDIIRNMTVHEQLRMLRNIIEDEEFKRREKVRGDRKERSEKAEQERLSEKAQRKQVKVKQLAEGMDQTEDESPCRCPVKKLDEMTYEELADQKPEQAIDGNTRLPLTRENLSVMDQAPKVQWNIASESASCDSRCQQKQDKVNERKERSPKRDKRNKAQKKQIKFNMDLDIAQVQKQAVADHYTAKGWNIAKQMNEGEIQRRQQALDEESESTSRVVDRVLGIADRNLVPQIPPVPRYVLGNHQASHA